MMQHKGKAEEIREGPRGDHGFFEGLGRESAPTSTPAIPKVFPFVASNKGPPVPLTLTMTGAYGGGVQPDSALLVFVSI